MNIVLTLFFEDEQVIVNAYSQDFAELIRQIVNAAIGYAAFKDVRHCKVEQIFIN